MTDTKQQTAETTREKLLRDAAEAEQLERALVDQLNNLPGRVAEARHAARSRYNVMFAERMAGRSTDQPVMDMSEAEAIAAQEPELKAKAKEAGLKKLRLRAAVHHHDAAAHTATFDKLGEPLAELEQQHAKVANDLKAVRNARMTAARRRDEASGLAHQYERAAALHEQARDPIVRM